MAYDVRSMAIRSAPLAAHVTLVGATLLHTFTHAYGSMFVPLYVMMRNDLGFEDVRKVTFLVTLYGIVYWGLGFAAGILADRFDRKKLLVIGLIGNALSIIVMGLTRQYEVLVGLSVVGGLFGALFHPAANTLIPAHYPKAPGLAIGLLGIGSGVGFFFGPAYAGWSAQHSTLGGSWFAPWQRPCIEMGIAGLVLAVLFAFTAKEAGPHSTTRKPPLPKALRNKTILHSVVLALREFTSVGSVSLSGLFLLNALKFDTAKTGAFLGVSMLVAAGVNPLMVYLSPGRRRLPVFAAVLIVAAVAITSVPYWPARTVLWVLVVFQALSLASSALSDAAFIERVSPEVRGRLNGILLSIVGGTGAVAPYFVGAAIDLIGGRANTVEGFYIPFAALGLIILVSTASAYTLSRLGPVIDHGHVPAESSKQAVAATADAMK